MYDKKSNFMMLLGNLTGVFIIAYFQELALYRIIGLVLITIVVHILIEKFLTPPTQE